MKRVNTAGLLTITITIAAAAAVRLGAENWPQWRGPGSQGVSTEKTLPTEWGPGTNIAWKTELAGSGHSSPIVWGDRIFLTAQFEGDVIPGQRAVAHVQGQNKDWVHPDSVAADRKHTLTLMAIDAKTGKEAWKTKRAIQISWGTPVLVPVGGRTELVTNGAELVIAYDPATGKELWQARGVESNAIHTPLVGHGLVVVTAGFPAKKIIALRPGQQPADTRVAWEYSKGTGYVVSNILYGDHIYLMTDNGIVTCLDAVTGKVVYQGGRPPVPSNFMGSPVAFGGMIAMTSEDGNTFMLKAGPVHEIVRTNSVDEPVFTSAALANGRIYIRGEKHLFAIGK